MKERTRKLVYFFLQDFYKKEEENKKLIIFSLAALSEHLLWRQRVLRRCCCWSFHHVHDLACCRERSTRDDNSRSCCVFLPLLALRNSSESGRSRRLNNSFLLHLGRDLTHPGPRAPGAEKAGRDAPCESAGEGRSQVPRGLPRRGPRVPRELRGHGGEPAA